MPRTSRDLPGGKAFCDTSFFVASLYPGDSNYDRAGDILAECQERSVTLQTTWDIVSETVTLLCYRASFRAAVQFLDVVKPTLAIVRYDDSVRSAAEEVFKKLSKDKKLSSGDTLSFVILTELLEAMSCLTFDDDFRSLGLMVYPE